MIINKEAQFTKDLSKKKMVVTREFEAPVNKVWSAWTESELLDQWWAPKPWKAETQSMNFTEGGRWFYFMVGPEGEKHGSLINYKKIVPQQSFTGEDGFADEQGNVNKDMPVMQWHVTFASIEGGTRVTVDITFESEAAMNQIIEMGFQEGFSMGLGNLDELLVKSRQQE